MNVRYHYLYLLLFMVAVSVFAEETVHVLQRGETVYSVARSYGVSFQEILMINGIEDARRVQAGQRLRIPAQPAPGGAAAPAAGGSASGASGGFTEYRVARGETLYSLARRYGITLTALRDLNGFSETYVLKEGDRIRVPQAAETVTVTVSGTDVRPTVTRTVDTSVRWPVAAKEVSYMTGKLYGVVLVGERSEPVKSLTQGTVVSAGPYRGFGRVAIVQMTGGYLYVYGGCETLSVKEGDRVVPGMELGKLGIDAVSEKPQLFLLVYRSNTPVDPAKAPRA
jgi:murein DD-endopeptidase MepM/ murein hydrolase activator NlpD